MAWRGILKLMEIPGTKRDFEIITSAHWGIGTLRKFLQKVDAILGRQYDRCRIRVSIDPFHDAKIPNQNISDLISDFLDQKYQNITLGFRSITGQADFVEKKLTMAINKLGLNSVIRRYGPLKSSIGASETVFSIDYKNIVNPGIVGLIDPVPLDDYVELISLRHGRSFTLGSLEYANERPGFDITINPNGDVVFYGIETVIAGNIHKEIVSYAEIERTFWGSQIAQAFYMSPFSEILTALRSDKRLAAIIAEVNNPYWITRNLEHRFPEVVFRILTEHGFIPIKAPGSIQTATGQRLNLEER